MIWLLERECIAKEGNLRKDVDHHPTNEHEFSFEQENNRLQRIDTCNHADGNPRDWSIGCGNMDDQPNDIDDGSREDLLKSLVSKTLISSGKGDKTYYCANQIDEDDKSHREAAKSTEVREENELAKVVNSGVDPSSTL